MGNVRVYYKSRDAAAYLGISAEELTDISRQAKVEVYYSNSEYRPFRKWRQEDLKELLLEAHPNEDPNEVVIAALLRVANHFFKYSPSHRGRLLKIAESREKRREALKKDLSILETEKKQPSIATQQRVHDQQESLKKHLIELKQRIRSGTSNDERQAADILDLIGTGLFDISKYSRDAE